MKLFTKSILALDAIFLIVLTIWSANKGLDVTDESLHLMDMINPDESNPIRKANVLIYACTNFFNPGFIFYRILRIILLISSSYFFAYTFYNFRWKTKVIAPFDRWTFILLVVIGTWCCYGFGTRILEYNSLGLILSFLILGFLIRSWQFGRAYSGFLVGIFCFIQFLNKFPSGTLITIVVIGLTLVLSFQKSIRIKSFQILLQISIGLLISGVLYSLLIQNALEWISQVREFSGTMKDHDIFELLEIYKTDLWRICSSTFEQGWYVLVAWFFIFVTIRFIKTNTWISVGLISIGILAFLFWIQFYNLYLNGTGHLYEAPQLGFMLMLIGVIGLATNYNSIQKIDSSNLNTFLLHGLMIAIPFLISIGTNNGLGTHAYFYMVFWLITFLSWASYSNLHHRTSIHIATVVVCTLFSSQIATAISLYPYRLRGDLFNQTIELKLSRETLLVDQRMIDFQKHLSDLKDRFSKNSTTPLVVIPLCKMPVIPYFMDGVCPGSSWLKNNQPESGCFLIEKSILNISEALVFLDSSDSLNTNFKQCLKQRGLNWNEYELVARFQHPINPTEIAVYATKSLIR